MKTRVLFFACVLSAFACAAAPAGAASPILPDGTYHYTLEKSGIVLGKSTIVVDRNYGLLNIGESASIAGKAVVSHRTLNWETFTTSSYSADIDGSHVAVAVSGSDATLSAEKKIFKITASSGSTFVVSENYVTAFAQLPATLRHTKNVTLACLCFGAFHAVPVIVGGAGEPLPSDVPTGDAGVSITAGGVKVLLWYDPQTFVLDRAEVPAQDFVISLASQSRAVEPLPPTVSATPVPLPSPHFTSRDVTFAADDGVMLAATLTMPEEAAKPVPAFVLVHGSGCNDRNEAIGPNQIFGQIANNLSNAGYAVLRYDKRSCGRSGGTFPVRDRLIADARNAIAYVRAQPGIDPARIYVLGHSEGGELAPSIAIADGKLRGIVLMAPPAIPLEKILMQQTLRTVAPADRQETERAEAAALKEIADGKKTDSFSEWLRSSFGVDPAALIAKVPCPILILQGTKDVQVLPADTPRLVDAAKAAGRNVTVVMLTGDDHLFINLPGDDPSTGAEYFDPAYLDPALFSAIGTWLQNAGK